ncbi:isopenicillin-N N-acyltransferase-like protein [Thermocatellispora tengchongensis]|uniref:Isopenicillin-N N-acyltransferase-like protein n=1 Tax=Thermocatellispora tengchongensis TaxID=1073253 RepID=A0A840NXR6_9ACTN|nr:C45 family peptidase [Thermocatellispora tengchongensis]MBB5131006.1 isopenicillin-N N-acyltransferase-like protein [Thermocatellispora tengchongensis]
MQIFPAAGPSLVAVEGGHREMGAMLGRQTRDLVVRSLDVYYRRFRDQAGLSEADVMRWGSVFLGVAREYHPGIAAMLKGLAEGAGQRAEHIAALNARTELLYGTGYREEGCTSLAVLPGHTADGHALLAQNWDWHPEQAPVTFLLATRDPEGFTVLTLAEAGMLAKSGLNSAGLGVCANLLVSDRDRGGRGVPYHFLLRGVLESPRMSVALRRTLDVTRVSSGNLLIGDAGGEAIDLEVAPGVFGHLLPEGGLLAHSNHFQCPLPLRDEKVRSSALTLLRAVRVRHLLQDAAAARAVTTTDIVAALRDHYSHPDGVCRHRDPETSESEACVSVYSIVMDLTARELFIAGHPVCGQAYARWRLDDLFTEGHEPEVCFAPAADGRRIDGNVRPHTLPV